MPWRRLPLPFLRERARPDDIAPRHEPGLSARQAELVKRVRFVVALARSLHSYGTAAPRLENAVTEVAATMGLVCNVNSSPTSLVFSFRAQGGPETILNEVTRVVRLEPGGRDLHRLSLADAVAEQVLDGELDVDAGYARLLEIEAMPGLDERLVVISYGLIATALAVMLGRGWADVIAALAIGTVVGLVDRYCAHRPHLRP
ncbi:MAG: threonine/serine exporter family protein, partial [Lysobacterales bacterium]